MKRRWKILIGLGAAAALFVAVPVLSIELGCRPAGSAENPYRALAGKGRPEGRTWLTYPEWHIVYAADALGAWQMAGKRPSGYPYLADARSFWSSYCALNRIAGGRPGAGDARVMLHVIGVSFTAEMLVKSLYENTVGRLTEAIGGWTSRDDAYAARTQQAYGRFMHETPWYAFPFGQHLSAVWGIDDGGFRHWERRAALTSEYGVKALYAKAIGGANSATLGPDEVTMHMVVAATPAQIKAADVRLEPVRALGPRLTLVKTPRYATFTDIVQRLAARDIGVAEIAGNDNIFVTALLRGPMANREATMQMPLPDGRVRAGFTLNVKELIPFVRALPAQGGTLEHIYDY